MKKALKVISYVLSLLVLFTVGFVSVKYFDEIRTLTSLKLVEGTKLYTMEFFADYHFDEFLKTGAKDNNEYNDYVNKIMNESLSLDITGSASDNACSAFTFRGTDGDRYVGRNFDNIANPVMLVVTSPDDAYKSISAVDMTRLGFNSERAPKTVDPKLFKAPYYPMDGVNEKGISVSILQVNFSRKQRDDGKTNIGIYAVVRLVLDYADSIENAVGLIDKYNIYFDSSMMAHFLIADHDGRSALIEFVNGETNIIYNDRSYQPASNFNNTEEFFDEDGYVHPEEYRSWLTNSTVNAYDSEFGEYIRYDYMLDSLYNSSGIMSVDDAFKLLETVASPSKLQYSVVYNLTDLQATVITDNDWEKRTTVALSGIR